MPHAMSALDIGMIRFTLTSILFYIWLPIYNVGYVYIAILYTSIFIPQIKRDIENYGEGVNDLALQRIGAKVKV